MKTYIKSTLLLIALFVSSCDLLDFTPEDYYSGSNYWKTTEHVDMAMKGLHSDLRNKYQMLFFLGEARGGTQKSGAASLGGVSLEWSSPVKDNTFSAMHAGTSSWYNIYPNILDVNLFIQKVEQECDFLATDDKAYYLGQAYGLRAFYYFWLYRTWGGVPIVEKVKVLEGKVIAENLYEARATPKATLDKVKEYINKSVTYFADDYTHKNTKSMWSLAASRVLKAEIYLWSAKVTTGDQLANKEEAAIAKEALEPLIGKYSLLNDFSDVFAEKGNDEVIMAIRFRENETSNFYGEFLSNPNNFVGQVANANGAVMTDVLKQYGSGVFRHEYRWGLFDSYSSQDTRRNKTFLDFYEKAKPNDFLGLVVRKNIGIISSVSGLRVYEGDVMIYRYADVLLLMAEVKNLLGENVETEINAVRKRAYGSNYAANKYVNASFAENELAILAERDKEFVQEGKRWFDVLRMHDVDGSPLVFNPSINYRYSPSDEATPILDKTTESHMVLWPIDDNTMGDDPSLEQTPGYN